MSLVSTYLDKTFLIRANPYMYQWSLNIYNIFVSGTIQKFRFLQLCSVLFKQYVLIVEKVKTVQYYLLCYVDYFK